MTSVASNVRLVEFTANEFRQRLSRMLAIYVEAMHYPPGTAEQRAPIWLAHVLRPGWRCIAALDEHNDLLGFAYGYQGRPDQWWNNQVQTGILANGEKAMVTEWLDDYFELTEIHIQPQKQGRGIGEQLVRRLLKGLPEEKVLLSTPEGTSRAWKLYRRIGFVDVLRDYRFAGDLRPFAVLGRALPLDPPSAAEKASSPLGDV